jgi:cellulase/cellobiase CelA1
VAGGRTIILTLAGDSWVTAGGTFDAQRQNIINGLDSAQSELLGWNNVVQALQGVAGVVRTSDAVVTITLDAFATYNITATETITATIPSTALTLGAALVAAPTFTVTSGVAVRRRAHST